MKDIRNIFRRLEKLLKEAKWFDDEWEIYNRGPYLQLYKSNWYNHNQGGIHFETSIEAPQLKSKSFPIAMHAEEDCPSRQIFAVRKGPNSTLENLSDTNFRKHGGPANIAS